MGSARAEGRGAQPEDEEDEDEDPEEIDKISPFLGMDAPPDQEPPMVKIRPSESVAWE